MKYTIQPLSVHTKKLSLVDIAIVFRKKIWPNVHLTAGLLCIPALFLGFDEDVPLHFLIPVLFFLMVIIVCITCFRDLLIMFSGQKECYTLVAGHISTFKDQPLPIDIRQRMLAGEQFALSYIRENHCLLRIKPLKIKS